MILAEKIMNLRKQNGWSQEELAQQLDIRRTPELTFVIDEAMENGKHIDEIIARIHEQDAKNHKE